MRISYHSFGPESNRAYVDALRRVLEEEGRRLGIETRLVTTSQSSVGGKQYRSLHPLDIAELTYSVWRAVDEGASAVVIGNIQDPGLYECRQLVNVPVIGLLESAIATAMPFGARIGLITTHDRVNALIRERLSAYGLSSRVVAIEALNVELTDLSSSLSEDVSASLVNAVERTVASLRTAGAEFVVAASGMLAVALNLASRSQGPLASRLRSQRIASPIPFALSAAHMAGALASRVEISRVGTYASPPLDEVLRYFRRLERLHEDQT